MSESEVDLVRRFIAAYNAPNLEALIAYCDPSIELYSAFAAVGAPSTDGLRSWRRDFEDAWGSEIRIEPEAYFDLGEQTLAFYVLHGRGRHSGVGSRCRTPPLRGRATGPSST